MKYLSLLLAFFLISCGSNQFTPRVNTQSFKIKNIEGPVILGIRDLRNDKENSETYIEEIKKSFYLTLLNPLIYTDEIDEVNPKNLFILFDIVEMDSKEIDRYYNAKIKIKVTVRSPIQKNKIVEKYFNHEASSRVFAFPLSNAKIEGMDKAWDSINKEFTEKFKDYVQKL